MNLLRCHRLKIKNCCGCFYGFNTCLASLRASASFKPSSFAGCGKECAISVNRFKAFKASPLLLAEITREQKLSLTVFALSLISVIFTVSAFWISLIGAHKRASYALAAKIVSVETVPVVKITVHLYSCAFFIVQKGFEFLQ